MSSFWDRLRDADPARDEAYRVDDLETMLSRVLAARPARPSRRLGWDLGARVAGAVALSGALTGLGIGLLAGAGTLVPLQLALSSHSSVTAEKSATLPVPGSQLSVAGVSVAPGPNGSRFSAVVETAPTVVLGPLARASAALDDLASLLGVRPSGPPRAVPGGWTMSTSAGELSVISGPVSLWRLSARSRVASTATYTSLAALTARVDQLVAGLGGSAGAVHIAASTSAGLSLRVPVLLVGRPSGLVDQFTLDAPGALRAGRGAAFHVLGSISYPLLSARASAARVSESARVLSGAITVPGVTALRSHVRGARLVYRVLAGALGLAYAVPTYVFGTSDGTLGSAAVAIPARYLRVGSQRAP